MYEGGAYIRDVNWVTYLRGVYSRGLYMGCVLTGFYGTSVINNTKFIVKQFN